MGEKARDIEDLQIRVRHDSSNLTTASSNTDLSPNHLDTYTPKEDDFDGTARYLSAAEDFGPMTPERERKLVRKIDFRIILVSPDLERLPQNFRHDSSYLLNLSTAHVDGNHV
jgi:hypothetical protein